MESTQSSSGNLSREVSVFKNRLYIACSITSDYSEARYCIEHCFTMYCRKRYSIEMWDSPFSFSFQTRRQLERGIVVYSTTQAVLSATVKVNGISTSAAAAPGLDTM